MWCVPEIDREYVERMEDVLDLYEKPLDKKEPVVCLDEKPIQLLGEARPSRPMKRGQPKRRDSEYVRKGTANVFCAVEPKTGKHMPRATRRRRGRDFAKMLQTIASRYPRARKIHLVMDNLSTHKQKSLIDALGEKDGARLWSKFEAHYTPKHASWLNQAEIAISMYSRACLGKDRIESFAALGKRTRAWERIAAREQPKIDWKFTKRKAREKFKYTRSGGEIKLSRY